MFWGCVFRETFHSQGHPQASSLSLSPCAPQLFGMCQNGCGRFPYRGRILLSRGAAPAGGVPAIGNCGTALRMGVCPQHTIRKLPFISNGSDHVSLNRRTRPARKAAKRADSAPLLFSCGVSAPPFPPLPQLLSDRHPCRIRPNFSGRRHHRPGKALRRACAESGCGAGRQAFTPLIS